MYCFDSDLSIANSHVVVLATTAKANILSVGCILVYSYYSYHSKIILYTDDSCQCTTALT